MRFAVAGLLQVPIDRQLVAVVDDDEAVRKAMKGFLRAAGFVAEVFSSAEEFLHSPNLNHTGCLVTDVNMPNMNGLDLYRSLSAHGKDIPTILITAFPSDDDCARALQEGVLCYLTKPFNERDLLGYVRTALDHRSG
jgi:FixJ family two-component response regulator